MIAALSNERGSYLAQSLIGALVSLMVLSVVGAGIIGIGSFQEQLRLHSSVTSQASTTDSTLRTDITWASQVKVRDKTSFTATIPGTAGQCRTSLWEIITAAETTAVKNTVVDYPTFDPSTNPVQCSGQASAPSTTTLIENASPDSEFTYRNTGGRELNFTNGTLAVTLPGAPPAGINDTKWSSGLPTMIILDTEVDSGTEVATRYRFAISALNLNATKTIPLQSSHFIPAGTLK